MLPKKVKLGYRNIEIRETDELVRGNNAVSDSSCSLSYIVVQTSLAYEIKTKAVFTQLVNLLVIHLNPDLDDMLRTILSRTIWAVLRDNHCLRCSKQDLPDSVRILGTNYRVKFREPHWFNDGQANNAYDEIWINGVLRKKDAWETLWHEIIEVIYFSMDFPRDNHERDVEALAFALCTMFDNDDFTWAVETDESKDNNSL